VISGQFAKLNFCPLITDHWPLTTFSFSFR